MRIIHFYFKLHPSFVAAVLAWNIYKNTCTLYAFRYMQAKPSGYTAHTIVQNISDAFTISVTRCKNIVRGEKTRRKKNFIERIPSITRTTVTTPPATCRTNWTFAQKFFSTKIYKLHFATTSFEKYVLSFCRLSSSLLLPLLLLLQRGHSFAWISVHFVAHFIACDNATYENCLKTFQI